MHQVAGPLERGDAYDEQGDGWAEDESGEEDPPHREPQGARSNLG
jgi:hypothetical protein